MPARAEETDEEYVAMYCCGCWCSEVPSLSLLGLERTGVAGCCFNCCPLLHRDDCDAKSFIQAAQQYRALRNLPFLAV